MGKHFLEKVPFISLLLVKAQTLNLDQTVWWDAKWDFQSSAFIAAMHFWICVALTFCCCRVESSLKNLKCTLLCPSHLAIAHNS